MRQEDKLKETVGTDLPFRVPEGYFKSFTDKLMASLPDYPEKPRKQNISVWQRIKPYVYLAAMFAGIWCMMQIFHRVSNAGNDHPDEFASHIYDPDAFEYEYYISEDNGADIQLEDEIISLYPSMDELKRDFYAQL